MCNVPPLYQRITILYKKQTISRSTDKEWAGERIVVNADVVRVERKLEAANAFLQKVNQDKNINPEQKEIVFTKLQNAKATYNSKEVIYCM
jgi:hypothetical protein